MVLWLLDVQLTEFAELRRNGKQAQMKGTELEEGEATIERQIKNMRQQIELFLARSVVLVMLFWNKLQKTLAKFRIKLSFNRKTIVFCGSVPM